MRDHYSGLLVNGHDQREWADALGTILGDRGEMIRMGVNAAAHAATFSWDNTAAATLQRVPQGRACRLTCDFQLRL